MQTVEELQLDFKDVEGDMDGDTSIAYVPRDREENIFTILRRLGCTFDNRWANAPEDAGRYRGNGLVSYGRTDTRGLRVSVDVGCWHSHDCCGCLSSLSYIIHLTDYAYIIIRSRGYNY